MTALAAGAPRHRGEIETLAQRVTESKGVRGHRSRHQEKKHYLTETIKPGPTANKLAEKVRTRFLAQVDERRSPRTLSGS